MLCKERYFRGTWNVRYTYQAQLNVVKNEMARVNIYMLGIRELKCWEWVNLIQMTTIYTTVGKNPLEERK